MSNPKISIIVPVYKAEDYLHRCMDSLLAQTFSDLEILLVDDGSPDSSGTICDKYAQKDSRVRVFHKENGGVSSARQYGIDNAIGEYTIHADPDDWMEPNMLEILYKRAKTENADMVICDFYEEYKYKQIYRQQKPIALDNETILKSLLSQQLHGSCWNKLIRKSCYNRPNVKFPINIIRWEDLYVICNILLYPIKIAYIPKALYHYDLVINNNSIIRKVTMKGFMSQIYFIDYFSKNLDNSIFDKELYKIKAVTKELAFTSELMSYKEVKELYSEINKRYIADRKFSRLYISLSLCLKGLPSLGRFYLNFMKNAVKLKAKIKDKYYTYLKKRHHIA